MLRLCKLDGGEFMTKISYEEMNRLLRLQRYKEISKYSDVVKLGIDTMWKELCDRVDSPDIDPTDIFDEELENLKNIEYSMKLMNICCLSETWEQDLFNFLKEKGITESRSNDYNETKKSFEDEYSSCKISNYPLIIEMRALVNAIKHGEGRSLTNIRRLTGDSILADSNLGEIDVSGEIRRKKQIEFDGNTLTSRTLNVDGKLEIYSDAIVKFWQDVFEVDKEKSRGSERE